MGRIVLAPCAARHVFNLRPNRAFAMQAARIHLELDAAGTRVTANAPSLPAAVTATAAKRGVVFALGGRRTAIARTLDGLCSGRIAALATGAD